MKMETGTLSVDTFNSWVRSKKEIVAGLLLASTLSIIFYHGSGSSGLRATQVGVSRQWDAYPVLHGDEARVIDCPQCPICAGRLITKDKCRNHVRYVADKHFYEGDKFGAKLYQCNHCEHTFTWPILKPDELSELYSTRYNRQSAEFIARPRAGQQFSLVWDSWTQLGLSPETNLVVGELGCARGFLLHEFEKVARQLYCWEPDPDMVWKMKGSLDDPSKLHVFQRPYMRDEDLTDESVHIWLASHVAEHIANPRATLSLIAKKTVPGGLIFWEVPRFMSPRGAAGDDMAHFHLNYFTPVSMDTAMASAGFCRVFVGFVAGGAVTGTAKAQWEEESDPKACSYGVKAMRVVYQKCGR